MYSTFHNHYKMVSSSINALMPSPPCTTNISNFGIVFSHSTTQVHLFKFLIYPKILFTHTFFLVVLEMTKITSKCKSSAQTKLGLDLKLLFAKVYTLMNHHCASGTYLVKRISGLDAKGDKTLLRNSIYN
jgi:hypothetical protein